MATLYLGLGSNIEPVRHLKLAITELKRRFTDVRTSTVYRNAPVGFEGEDFLNLVVKAQTELSPAEVVRELEEIHQLAGRVRGNGVASRELDIDLLLYDRLVLAPGADIEIPRTDVLSRDFVLRPLSELAPDFVHPLTGQRLAEHWARFDAAGRTMHREPIDL
jgi:2-amino-4-hydroxy-6-hydroxymethyldihydropteridine diphosphokinase